MNRNNYEEHHVSRFLAGLLFFAGLMLGGFIGAITMLLMAPRSGKKTRRQLQRKGQHLREQAMEVVDDSVGQARSKVQHIKSSIQEQGQEVVEHLKTSTLNQSEALQKRGQEVVEEVKNKVHDQGEVVQLRSQDVAEHLKAGRDSMIKAGKTAVNGTD